MNDQIVEERVECIDLESGVNILYKMTPASYKVVFPCVGGFGVTLVTTRSGENVEYVE